jgi:hypothetical protein
MKTADLIAQLAQDVPPVPRGVALRRLAPPALVGAAVAAVAVVVWLGLRPLGEAAQTFSFWMKGGYTALLAAAGAAIVLRMSRPGGSFGPAVWLASAAFVVMAGLSAGECLGAAPADRLALWLGASWTQCSFRILVLAVPIYVGLLVGLRRMAPTRPGLTGATAGFLAGAAGATVYQLFCPETGAMFVTTWYTLGVLASTAAGALVGRRLLRW